MGEASLKEKTAKGLFWGGVSNGLQQMLSLVFGIILARTLSQEDYGMFTMLLIFTTMANLLLDSGFTTALINKKETTDTDYNAVFWFSCAMGAGLYLLLFLAAPYITRWLGVPQLTTPARFLFLWFLFCSTGTVHNAILVKRLMLKEKAKIEITAFLAGGITAVVMAFNGMVYWSLFVQMVLQGFVATLLRWYFSPWKPRLTFSVAPLKAFFPFSVKLLITGVFNALNAHILGPLIGKYYSPAEAGRYGQGYKWGYMTYSVVWGMIHNVSQPVLAQLAGDPDRQVPAFRKLLRFVSFIVFPGLLGLAFVSQEFITITVTDKWAESVPYMQLFCVWGAITPLNNLCANAIISHGQSGKYMGATIALDIVQLAVIILAHPYGLMQMVRIYVCVNLLWFFVWYLLMRRHVPVGFLRMLCDILPFLAVTLLGIGVSWLLTSDIDNLYLRFILKIGITAAIYLGVLYLCHAVVLQESLQFLKKQFKR